MGQTDFALPALPGILDSLDRHYRRPRFAKFTDPLTLIWLENVANLLNVERRAEAFQALRDQIGLEPDEVLKAPKKDLLAVAKLGGMRPEERVEKLRSIAELAKKEFPSGARKALKLPVPELRRKLRKFPGIGDPGADKILLLCGCDPVPAFDSNGLRVLTRLGFTVEQKNYSATYRAAQAAVAESEPDETVLVRAYHLLRHHGQELCRRSKPVCGECPVAKSCKYSRDQRLSRG